MSDFLSGDPDGRGDVKEPVPQESSPHLMSVGQAARFWLLGSLLWMVTSPLIGIVGALIIDTLYPESESAFVRGWAWGLEGLREPRYIAIGGLGLFVFLFVIGLLLKKPRTS